MTDKTTEAMTAGYVLAGGGSTRFGSDKALVNVGGTPMLARMIVLLQVVTGDARIVGPPEKYAGSGIAVVPDRWPGEGPLGGIITALENTATRDPRCQWNLIVGCDMPFLTRDWLSYLRERAAKCTARVLLPHSASGPEPLCACYRTDAAERLRAVFEAGVRKITDALKQVKTEVLDEREGKRFDSAGRLFWNMNTAADYEEARRVLQAKQG